MVNPFVLRKLNATSILLAPIIDIWLPQVWSRERRVECFAVLRHRVLGRDVEMQIGASYDVSVLDEVPSAFEAGERFSDPDLVSRVAAHVHQFPIRIHELGLCGGFDRAEDISAQLDLVARGICGARIPSRRVGLRRGPTGEK